MMTLLLVASRTAVLAPISTELGPTAMALSGGARRTGFVVKSMPWNEFVTLTVGTVRVSSSSTVGFRRGALRLGPEVRACRANQLRDPGENIRQLLCCWGRGPLPTARGNTPERRR